MIRLAVALNGTGLGLAGCAAQPAREPSPAPAAPASPIRQPPLAGPRPIAQTVAPVTSPQDAQPDLPAVVQLTIYEIDVPAGSASRSEVFWKHLDEQAVDIATQDLLYKNGLRAGTAPVSDWNYFRQILDDHPATTRKTVSATVETGTLELEARKDVAQQTIFDFDARNSLTGRTYQRASNLLSVNFQKSPRTPGTVRIAVTPLVRSERRRLVAITDRDQAEVREIYPEHYFDLTLRVDVPIDRFLVVAPSPEAFWPASLGHAFLLRDSDGEQREQLILLTVRMYQGPEKPRVGT